MNYFLIILLIIYVVIFVFIGIYLYKIHKDFKLRCKNYPVKHRLDENGYFQYSVDGKLWTYLMGFVEDFNYGKYKGPGFTYIKFLSNETDTYKQWCNMLNNIDECHEWNKSALNHYREAINKYIKNS